MKAWKKVIPLEFLGMIGMAAMNGGLSGQSLAPLLLIFVIVMLMVILLTKKGKKIDAAARTRKNLDELLRTPQ